MPYRPIRSPEDLARAVAFGETTENRWLEFKALYEDGPEADDELARDIAQFANTEGGVLLIGIAEDRRSDGRHVAREGPGVADVNRLKARLEQSIRNHLVPSTFTREVVEIESAGKVIVAVNVPPSIALVALSHPEEKRGIEYLYRTDLGKSRMNPSEVERHMMNGSRASRLAVQRLHEELGARFTQPLDLVPPIVIESTAGVGQHREHDTNRRLNPIISDVSEHHVQITLGSSRVCVNLPYSLIRDAWIAADQRPALALAVRIVANQADAYLEPVA